MGALPPKFCKNCIKSRENARFSCKTPKAWRYFCAFLPLDKRQFDRPTMVDYAGIFIKSTVRINKFQFAVLYNPHKKSRKSDPDPDSAPHMASPLIAGRGRPRGPEFPLPRPYANFSVASQPTRPIWPFPEN